MTIRRARPDDLGAVQQCAADAYQQYVARIGREPAPMIADFKSRIDRGIVHVAVDDQGVDDEGGMDAQVRGFMSSTPRAIICIWKTSPYRCGFRAWGSAGN